MAPSASATGARKTHYGLVANAHQKHGAEDKSSSVERTTRARGKPDRTVELSELRCTKCRERGILVCTTTGGSTRRMSCDQCVEDHCACSLAKRKAADLESGDDQEDDDGGDATPHNKVAPLKPALRRVRYKEVDSDDNSIVEIDPPSKPKPKPKPKPAMRSSDNSGGSATPANVRVSLVPPPPPPPRSKAQGRPDPASASGWQRRSHGVIVASAVPRPGGPAGRKARDDEAVAEEEGGAAVSSRRLELLHDAREAFFEKLHDARDEVAGDILDRVYLKAKAWMDAEELVLGV